MRKKMLVVLGSVVFLLLGFNVLKAEELEMKPYLYEENFEGEDDPVKFWCSNGKYTVNFKGLTEEKAFSGKKSFKLDVTFQSGSYFYWKIPLTRHIPAEGKLKFSGYIYVEQESAGSASLGVNYSYFSDEKRIFNGCCSRFGAGTKGKWLLVEGDIVKSGKENVDKVMRKYNWEVIGDNVGTYLDFPVVFLDGREGDGIVVYVDDIKIEGEIPAEKDYKEEIKRRWAPAKKRFNEKISAWEEILEKAEKEIASLANLSKGVEKIKKEAESNISSLKAKIETAKKEGRIHPRDVKEIESYLKQLKNNILNIKAISVPLV